LEVQLLRKEWLDPCLLLSLNPFATLLPNRSPRVHRENKELEDPRANSYTFRVKTMKKLVVERTRKRKRESSYRLI
jgi:hypothetical protein